MKRYDPTALRGDSARGDSPSDAGRSLRGIVRARRQYWRTFEAFKKLPWVIFAGVAAMGVLVFMGHMNAALIVGLVAVVIAMSSRFFLATHGSSLLYASAGLATVVALWTSYNTGAMWWDYLIVAAAMALTVTMRPRFERLPVLPVAVACQWLGVAIMFAHPWLSYAAAPLALAVAAAGAVAVNDRAASKQYYGARSRSQIPVTEARDAPTSLGLQHPPAMSEDNIAKGIEAEVATAKVLDELGPEYIVLHSRQIPGSNADIDHLVIGPHGVALVDSKFRNGDMRYRTCSFKNVAPDQVPTALAGELADGTENSAPLSSLDDAANAAVEQLERVAIEQPDEALPDRALQARHRAYEVFRAANYAGGDTLVGEWTLNGYSISSALASSTIWEASRIEEALQMPADAKVPVLLSIYGARMDVEAGQIPMFDEDGVYSRDVNVVHVRALADAIRELPQIVANPTMVDDLATVVHYRFPPKH